jgi:hypothetical protein
MIIEVVIFFAWMFSVLLIGVVVILGKRRKEKLQSTDNVNALTFPQRNWLPLVLIVALVSPLVVTGVKAMTHKPVHEEPVVRTAIPGDSSGRDTSYHVATPPQR